MEIGKELEYFSLMTGLTPEEALPWLPLCSSCRERIQAQLRPGVVWEQEERLAFACGAMASYLYQQRGGEELSQIKLGDVTVQAKNVEQAAKLQEEAWNMIGDLVDKAGVQLLGVAYEY